MSTRWLIIVMLAGSPVFGQLESHTVSVTASRSINLQPDQALLSLTVTSATIAPMDQVVSALSSLGVTAANLNGVSNSSNPPSVLWYFNMTAPLKSLTSTINSLTTLQQTITQNNSGLSLNFSVNGTQVSNQLRQSQSCSSSDLISDATAQGQKLAAAAGMSLGPLLSVSQVPLTVPAAIGRVGGFAELEVGAFTATTFVTTPPSPVTCSVSVQFRLLP